MRRRNRASVGYGIGAWSLSLNSKLVKQLASVLVWRLFQRGALELVAPPPQQHQRGEECTNRQPEKAHRREPRQPAVARAHDALPAQPEVAFGDEEVRAHRRVAR